MVLILQKKEETAEENILVTAVAKIQDLTFLIKNYCLTELYLNNNELTDISGCEFGKNTNKVPSENPEDAVLVRAVTRSLTEFSFVDWNTVATCQERRLQNRAEEPPEKLTVQFR
ncbi:Leucine-rich repeat-containing protein 72 [Willisornis vidua]|uniref:Leucine-rich repeat-containing protein 72 n=1 Tax=Willisornis vidua TaxID=1566151 RepID=A0ABQ9DG65_9PASS|nr:Leucine-rich repeat-containing protein 72 [Willisornis vidua]